jgi:hypothetical protein
MGTGSSQGSSTGAYLTRQSDGYNCRGLISWTRRDLHPKGCPKMFELVGPALRMMKNK